MKNGKTDQRRAPKVRVVYLDSEGCAFRDQRQVRQLTRQDLDRMKARYTVIIERID